MNLLTTDSLIAATGCTALRAEQALDPANQVVTMYGLNTVARMGMWLANIGHETGNLKWNFEIWGPTEDQKSYDTKPDLGNMFLGDGQRFKGRGWFQTTGRGNYGALQARLTKRWPNLTVPNFIFNPELLEKDQWAALSAADYMEERNLVAFADRGDFDGYCDVINLGHKGLKPGMANGFKDRQTLWEQAQAQLALEGWD